MCRQNLVRAIAIGVSLWITCVAAAQVQSGGVALHTDATITNVGESDCEDPKFEFTFTGLNSACDRPEADVKWEVTPEGTCRLTVTDVRSADAVAARDDPVADCGGGAGTCGAPLGCVSLTLIGLVGLRSRARGSRVRSNS